MNTESRYLKSIVSGVVAILLVAVVSSAEVNAGGLRPQACNASGVGYGFLDNGGNEQDRPGTCNNNGAYSGAYKSSTGSSVHAEYWFMAGCGSTGMCTTVNTTVTTAFVNAPTFTDTTDKSGKALICTSGNVCGSLHTLDKI